MRGRVLSLCVAASILAGCGSSKAVSTASPATTTTAAKAAAPASATTVAAAATTAGAASTAAGAAPKLTGAADNDFCRYLVEQGKKAVPDGPLPNTQDSPEQLKLATTETQTLFGEMAKRAPAEIKAEMSAVSASFNRLAAIYASVGYDTKKLQEQMADPTSAVAVEFSKIGENDMSGAGGEKVDAYIQDVCGLKG